MKLYKQPNNNHALVDKWEQCLSTNYLGLGMQSRAFGLLVIAINCFCSFSASLSFPSFQTYIVICPGNYMIV